MKKRHIEHMLKNLTSRRMLVGKPNYAMYIADDSPNGWGLYPWGVAVKSLQRHKDYLSQRCVRQAYSHRNLGKRISAFEK